MYNVYFLLTYGYASESCINKAYKIYHPFIQYRCSMRKHMMYTCKQCKKCFQSLSKLEEHRRRQKPCRPATHLCDLCDKALASSKSLWNHKQLCRKRRETSSVVVAEIPTFDGAEFSGNKPLTRETIYKMMKMLKIPEHRRKNIVKERLENENE